MLATLRAAISLIALIGFFVFAVALSAAVIFVGVAVAHILRNVGVWIVVVGAISALGVLVALARMSTFRPPVKPGVDVTPEGAPALWALVNELADGVRTGTPAHIRLTHDVNAEVSEDARFFGLSGGVRRMYLGVPLLQGLTVSQLQGNVIQWPLRLYAGLYIVMSLAMSRSQEREADRLERFLGMGWGMDLAPTADEFFGGFERLLAARVDERGRIRRELELPAEGTLLDSHPPIAERIALMEARPDRGVSLPDDERPASALMPAFGRLATETAEQTFVFGYRERLDWDELSSIACGR